MTDRLAATAVRTLAPRATVQPASSGDALANVLGRPLPDGAGAYVTGAVAAYRLVKAQASAFVPDGVQVVTLLDGGGVWVRESELFGGFRCVRSLADLPDPVAGDIQLADDTEYCILGNVDIGANRLVAGNNTFIRGRGFPIDSLVSSHPTATISVTTDATFNVERLTVQNTTAGAHAITAASVTSQGVVALRNVLLTADSALQTTALSTLRIEESILSPTGATGVGLEILGAHVNVTLVQVRLAPQGASGVGIDIPAGASVERFVLFLGDVIVPVATQTGILAGGTITRGFIESSSFSGAGTFTSGFTKATVEWRFLSNVGLLDSVALGEAAFNGGPNTATISVAGTPVAIPGAPAAFVTSAASERFEQDPAGSGILKYTGLPDVQVRIIGTASVDQVGGGVDQLGLSVALNGSQVATSLRTAEVSTSGQASQMLVTDATLALATDDTVQLFVQNNTDTSNIRVYAAGISALCA